MWHSTLARNDMTLTFRPVLRILAVVLCTGLFLASARAEEKLPEGAKLTKIEAQPANINLKNPFEYAQLILTGQLESGERIDVTRMAKIELPAAVVKVSATGQIRPVADGDGAVKATLAGQTVSVPLTFTGTDTVWPAKVSGQKDKYEVSFVRDV